MENLISMTDYVLEQEFKVGNEFETHEQFYLKNINYAKFLSMPLELKMFVPCDSENNVLEKELFSPIWKDYHNKEGGNHELYLHNLKIYNEYQKALSEVIFEGFKVNYTNESGSFEIIDDNDVQVYYYKSIPKYGLWLGSQKEKTIEHMITYNRTLTPNAKLKYKF